MAVHNELGKVGEEIACTHLISEGYKILERNYRFQKAEIDIIAQLNNEIVIVEVKTRNSDFFGDPQEFITPKKIKLLVKAANEYVISNNISLESRFDVIAVLKNKKHQKVTHFKNAFYHF